jgi:phosphonate metabolism protein (transferase hexapeptide repeat family)
MTKAKEAQMAVVKPGNKLSSHPSVANSSHISSSQLGQWTEIGERCLLDNVQFGDYSYVQDDVDIALSEVGKFVSIASKVRINPSNHPWWRASQHHFSYRPQKYGLAGSVDAEVFNWRAEHKVKIGHDVWIGHGAIIMPGVNIGNGAIIGSGSVVTKDVPAWHIAVGNPAKLLRPRFNDPELGKRLEKLAWWDWSQQQLAEALPLFQQDCLAFVEHYEQQLNPVP